MRILGEKRTGIWATLLLAGRLLPLLVSPLFASPGGVPPPPLPVCDALWATNVRVNDDAGRAQQSDPSIAVDPAANLYAIWEDRRNGNGDVFFSYRPAGAEWEANVMVNDVMGTARQSQPVIAVDLWGNAYALWSDERNGNYDIYFSYRPAGGTWGTDVRVNDDVGTGWQAYPSIAVDPVGNAHAVWTDARAWNWKSHIYYSYRPAGGSWGANVRIDDDAGMDHDYQPSIGVDVDGNGYVLWEDWRDGSADIYFSYRPAGGSWGPNVRVDDDLGSAGQWAPSIAVSGTGNACALWEDNRDGHRQIYFSSRPANGAWVPDARLTETVTAAWQLDPSVAMDPDANAYVLWEHYQNSISGDIYSAVRPVGSSWTCSAKVDDDLGTADQSDPSLAVDTEGNAYAVWADYRSDDWDIYFSAWQWPPTPPAQEEEFVPELGTLALLAGGLLGLAGYARLLLYK